MLRWKYRHAPIHLNPEWRDDSSVNYLTLQYRDSISDQYAILGRRMVDSYFPPTQLTNSQRLTYYV